MANNIIDKIQISGQSYDVKDSSAATVVELTQQEYDALPSSAKTGNTLFVITDAQAGDLTNYYTKTETNTLLGGKADTATTYTKTETDNAITAATSTKQDTLVSGTNIKTINNTSILGSGNIDIQGGGGGKAIEAGRGISITTGETADTVSFNLALSAGTSTESIIGGRTNTVVPEGSFAFGWNNSIYYDSAYSSILGYNNKIYNGSTAAHIVGSNNEVRNSSECAVGKYNTSSTGSTDADKTLFSVGNGTSTLARHNAFEIRRNGDVYLNDGTNDVKLQDYLQIKVVKLTQSAYDALSPDYDSNTLYVIVN